MGTPVNRLSVPEIAHYRRECVGSRVVIVYAIRKPLMSLWTGVRIEHSGDVITERHTAGPFLSAALAAEHAATCEQLTTV